MSPEATIVIAMEVIAADEWMIAVMSAPATIRRNPLWTEARNTLNSSIWAKEVIDDDIMLNPQNSMPNPEMIWPVFLKLSLLATDEMMIPRPANDEKIVLRLTVSESNRPRATIWPEIVVPISPPKMIVAAWRRATVTQTFQIH
ncbi:MAG: hypothetical protein II126_05340 [Erysipelotrichaceae bacterium]|nr:hypothetical protein [Erysipelotrichaceae bacterium]